MLQYILYPIMFKKEKMIDDEMRSQKKGGCNPTLLHEQHARTIRNVLSIDYSYFPSIHPYDLCMVNLLCQYIMRV